MKDFRRDLDEELSSIEAPPVGDLVGQAVRQGRRSRRRRTLGAVAGSALAVAGVALLLGGPLWPHVGGAAATVVAADRPDSSASAAPGTGPAAQLPTTGVALLAALVGKLPEGSRTDGFAAQTVAVDGAQSTGAQVQLRTATGHGMIRVFLSSGYSGSVCGEVSRCLKDGRGQEVSIDRMEANCVQDTIVTVRHHDGTVVQLNLASCLSWDAGKGGNQTGSLPLTEEQAVALAGDPALSLWMTADEGLKARAAYPDLPRIS